MPARRKRILFIVPSLVRAGAETQVVDLANGLDPCKFEKHLLTFESQLDQLARVDRTHVQFYNHPRQYKFDFGMVGKIAELIDTQKIDVVHCTLQIALLMGWLGIRRARRTPALLVAVHTTVNRYRKDELLDRCLYRWLLRSCAKIIFVCHAQEAYWLRKFPSLAGRTAVVYNGVDQDYFSRPGASVAAAELRATLAIPPDAAAVACIAGFRPEKGHLLLLDAFQTVISQGVDAHLLLAGDGPTRGAVEAFVKVNRLSTRVHFLGALEDVRPVLAAADVNVIASTAVETFSIAMLEAMSMEVPVIATDLGGAREALVDAGGGSVVPSGDAAALAAEITRVLSAADRGEMGDRARSAVIQRFSLRKMLASTAAVLAP